MSVQDTQNLNKNISPRKVLAAVLKTAQVQDETRLARTGATVITPISDIRAGNKAQILLPLMGEIIDTKQLHADLKASNLQGVNGIINEFTLNLSNRKSTKREYVIWNDGKEVGFDEIMLRQEAMGTTVATGINRNYYKTVVAGVINGVDAIDSVDGYTPSNIVLKGKVVDTSSLTDPKDVVVAVQDEIDSICDIKDRYLQAKIGETDLVLFATRKFARNFQRDSRYNVYDRKDNIDKRDWDAQFDGVNVVLTKQLPAGIDAILVVKGVSGSIFLLEKTLTNDKVAGAQASWVGVDFKEGSGIWLPQFATVFTSDVATYPVQDRKTFSDIIVEMNAGQVKLENGGNAGAITPNAPIQPTLIPAFAIADITATFSGTDGSGTVAITGPANVEFVATPDSGLTNGDDISVVATPAAGYKFADGQQDQFDFVVANLS